MNVGMCYSSLGFYSPKDKKMIAGFGYSYVEGAKAFTSEFHCKIQGAALVFKSPIAFEVVLGSMVDETTGSAVQRNPSIYELIKE